MAVELEDEVGGIAMIASAHAIESTTCTTTSTRKAFPETIAGQLRGLVPMLLTVLFFVVPVASGGTPAPEQFFHDQLVDHLGNLRPTPGVDGKADLLVHIPVWTQRYYTWDKYFQGPGSPIFVILGGEGSIEPETGLFYPFVTHHLAEIFGAFVLEPEHRFYGKSQPLEVHAQGQTQDPRVKLFTSEQALHDAMYLLDNVKETLGCSMDRFSKAYCPVVTVGGSYPGWLSAMARLLFPQKVDMAYAASAPVNFYSQQVNQYDYYDLITQVAEDTFKGCSNAVRSALLEVQHAIVKGDFNESELGICQRSTPSYLHPTSKNGLAQIVDELMMVVEYSFANANMANYPPSNQTRLFSACQTFTSTDINASTKVKEFLSLNLPPRDADCWNFTSQLPSGPNATITSENMQFVDKMQYIVKSCLHSLVHMIPLCRWRLVRSGKWGRWRKLVSARYE